MTPLLLQTVIADFGALPAANETVTQLVDYLAQDEIEVSAVARMIARDPVLAAKSLRLANSSVYGLQRPVSTILDAVTVLGQQSISTMVTAMAVTGRFRSQQATGYDLRLFWLHNVATALSARALARYTRLNPESAFAAGLIHDIGTLVLATRFPEHFAAVLDYQREQDCRTIDAERKVLGFDHAAIGGALAQEWKFAPEVARAVAGHHEPEQHPASTLTSLIHLANVMAHVLNFAEDENDLVPRISEFACERLSLDWSDFKCAMAEVDGQRQDAELFFS